LIHCIVVHIKNVASFGRFADLTWVGIYHITIPYYYFVRTLVKISKEASGQCICLEEEDCSLHKPLPYIGLCLHFPSQHVTIV
jgi:hypothetical protein